MNEIIKDIDKGQIKDIEQPLSVRYKLASLQVLENLRNTGNPGLTEAMAKFNCLPPEKPTEEELEAFRKFREDVYPALSRLKDLQAKTIEAIHKKTMSKTGEDMLQHERIETLTGLLKAINHDIEIASGSDRNKVTNNVFIFNDERAKRIAARLAGRDGKLNSYTVPEESN